LLDIPMTSLKPIKFGHASANLRMVSSSNMQWSRQRGTTTDTHDDREPALGGLCGSCDDALVLRELQGKEFSGFRRR
jgi:hypothetical protein